MKTNTLATPMTAGSPGLADLLGLLVENKGSDLHLQAGEVPIGRFGGVLGRFELPALSESDLLRLAREVLGSDEKLEEFQATRDWDTAVAVPNLGRFRANLFYQRNLPGMVLRTIGASIPTLAARNHPHTRRLDEPRPTQIDCRPPKHGRRSAGPAGRGPRGARIRRRPGCICRG